MSQGVSISKQEYLQRYLCAEDDSKKKVVKKTKKTKIPSIRSDIRKSKIVDDDIDLRHLAASAGNDDRDDEYGDEAPLVAAFVDERPAEVVEMEAFQQVNRWRKLGADHDSEDPASRYDSDLSPDRPRTSRRTRHDSGSSNASAASLVLDDNRKRPTKSDGSNRRNVAKDFFDSSPARNKPENRNYDRTLIDRKKDRYNQSRVSESDNSDQSPPRRNMNNDDQSPPRRKTNNDSDQSPPRKGRNKTDQSQSRRNQNDTDQSPLRRNVNNDSDQSPPRRHKNDSDQSPPRKRKSNQTSSDQSPPRRKMDSRIKAEVNSDQSPPRRSRQSSPKRKSAPGGQGDSRKNRSRWDPAESNNSTAESNSRGNERSSSSSKSSALPTKTLDGKMAGLQDAATLKKENDAAKLREQKMFEQLGDEFLGRNASTIVRDRASGKQRDLEAEGVQKAKEEAEKAAREAKYKEWSQGLKQRELQAQRVSEVAHEMSKPLARYDDDTDLDRSMRDQERTGDPMLEYMRKKRAAEKRLEAGAEAQPELPKYRGPAPPPNRYQIGPGYRWDGVDRSNGFEKSRVARQANKMAVEEDAYKWSVENM